LPPFHNHEGSIAPPVVAQRLFSRTFYWVQREQMVDQRRDDGFEASKDRPETLQSVKDTKTDPKTSAE